MKGYVKPFLALGIYFMGQMIASVLLIIYVVITKGPNNLLEDCMAPTPMAILLIGSTIFSIMVISMLGLIRRREVFSWDSMQDHRILYPILASIAGIFAFGVAFDYAKLEGPDMSGLMHNMGGVLYIAVIGPLGEELCCREALLGGLLRRGVRPWVAILISAFFFGILHCNMGQFLAGGAIGILLGILYYKTGNVLLSSLLHILNNSVSVLLVLQFGNTASTVDLLGGAAIAIPLALILAVACICYFVRYWKTV